MIFKPKVKGKFKQFFQSAVVLLLLTVMGVASLQFSTQVRAASTTVLVAEMPYFVKIGDYDIIETTGKSLNAMFDLSKYNKSTLNATSNYIAYYKIDKEKSSSITWSTYINIWHTKKWNGDVRDYKSKSGYLFDYQALATKNTKAATGTGQKNFKHYKTNISATKKDYVGNGKIGTLHYFCIDAGTQTGDALNGYKEKNADKEYISFYISPVILNNSNGAKYYTCDDWYRFPWADRTKSHYIDHYDQEVRFKPPQVEVTSACYDIGKQKKDGNSLLIQSTRNLAAASSSAKEVKTSDYIWGPDGDILTDSKNKELKKVTYHPFSKKSYTVKNPESVFFTKTDEKTGQTRKYMCVGYRLSKKMDKDSGGEQIVLASTMIELHKGSTGEYVPYFVEEKDGTTTKTDVAGDASATTDSTDNTISLPAEITDRHVTVKRYNSYKSTKSGACKPNSSSLKGKEITVSKWENEISKVLNWCNATAWGIRHEDGDTVAKIYVQWYYAPVSDEESQVVLEQYFTSENENIKTIENPSVDDSRDLEYKHTSTKKPQKVHTKQLATVQEGSPWVSYKVAQTAEKAYKLKDGTTSPKSMSGSSSSGKTITKSKKKTAFKNKKPTCDFTADDLIEKKNETNGIAPSYIPLVLHRTAKDGNALASNNYLYKLVIQTSHDSEWTTFTGEQIWGGIKASNGKIVKSKSKDRSYTTYAPYMQRYVRIKDAIPLQLRSLTSDWQQDAFNMTHFIIPEVRGTVTIKAYYTATLPVKTLVYKKSGGIYQLDSTQTQLHWVSSGTTYKGSYDGGYTVSAIIAAQGTHASSKPYIAKDYTKQSFKSEAAVERYYPDHTNLDANTGNFNIEIKERPVTIVILVDVSPPGHYFTQVQYVHTQDGKYHFVKSWTQEITTLYGESPVKAHHTYWWTDKYGGRHKGYTSFSCPATTVKAFVSFPQYVSWDDGNTGLYGSLYEEQGIDFEYSGLKVFPKVTTRRPGKYHTKNNSTIYLTEAGHLAQDDYADRTAGGDNSLVAYCIYEDIFNTWENEEYNPNDKSKNPMSIDEIAISWNWPLPDGFVWDSVDITSEDSVDETVYKDEYTNPFVATVLGTQGSAAYDAQDGIPTTDVIRAEAEVPRYLTKGYWTRKKLAWAYKVYAVYVTQHKSSKTIAAGDNCPDDHGLTACIPGCSHCAPVKCTFDYYTSDKVEQSTVKEVRRDSVYYTLGDAEVWDPQYVTLKDDVFSNSDISRDDTITLYGNGTDGGYESNARFFKTGDGSFDMPSRRVRRQYVNYGTYNDWESSGEPDDDLDDFDKDAESIISNFMVKNDTVSFFDGLGQTYLLSDGSMGKQTKVQIPSFPPESDLTYPGIFDSYNSVPDGIQIKTEAQNGHHETCSIAYYRQIQCIPTAQYRTTEKIKTKIADDDDDDVLVYTPTVNDSQINLDYDSTGSDASGISLYPNYDFDQVKDHSLAETYTNIQLDREYTMTLSVKGYASALDGYGYQDYVRYLAHDKYDMPYTQVKFPFPVQMKIRWVHGGTVHTDDRYYYANTWINIEMVDESGNITGVVNQTFFVPSWATEAEKATIRFRSIAINGDANNPSYSMENEETNDEFVESALQTSDRHNAADERDYVAWKEETDTVSGRISSFRIIDVTDYPAWQSVFRKLDTTTKTFSSGLLGREYHSGISNESGFLGNWGTLYTTPVVGTSNPATQSPGTLGLGYKIRYQLDTVGPYYNQSDKVTITPKFYYMNDKGEYLQIDGTYSNIIDTRAEVNVYYGETVNGVRKDLVRVGSADDKLNHKYLSLSDDAWDVSQAEISRTNDVLGTDNVGSKVDTYTFAKTTLSSALRLLVGDEHVSSHRGLPQLKASDSNYEFNDKMYQILRAVEDDPEHFRGTDYETLAKQLSSDQVFKSVQTWYGEYYLPSDTYVTTENWATIKSQISENFTGKEDCWLHGGRLVISFNPEVSSETKQTLQYSTERVSSLDNKNFNYVRCNEFKIENSVTAKMLLDGSTISLNPGDVLVYDFYNDDRNKAPSAKDAYGSSGSH